MNIQIFGKTECLRVKMLLNQCFEIVSIETYDQFRPFFLVKRELDNRIYNGLTVNMELQPMREKLQLHCILRFRNHQIPFAAFLPATRPKVVLRPAAAPPIRLG